MDIHNILWANDISRLSFKLYDNINRNDPGYPFHFPTYSLCQSSTAVNFRILHKTFGWGNHLLASFFNSLTNFLFTQKDNEPTEEDPKDTENTEQSQQGLSEDSIQFRPRQLR